MAPWESDTEAGSSISGSDDECTPTSGPGDVDAQSPQKMSFKTWKQEFFNRLGEIKTFGDFACMTRYSHHINPGLEVAGSLIPLPLVTRDADTIKSKCEQAPFGRGDDTVVDESVRKTWQLDSSLFRCSNPAWSAFLDTVLQETVQKLGMPKGTRAVPWKLLLYEEGSFFRPHKDSEKAPGMIGTLVISLPSKHEGGQVHLSHGNRRHIFATSNFSSFDLTGLAWYSDVTHEIKPLSSGYRLVITYNLLQQRGSPPSAGVFIEQQAQLQALLQKWASALQSKTRVIYRLDHKYSQSSLSIQNMKGRDAQRIRCLKQACQEAGFYILLAIMTRTEGCEDDYYGGDDEDSLELDHVTSLDGSFITRSVDVEMKEILGPDPYKDRRADSEDEGEFTGNESMPSQYRYHDSALLIVPSSGLIGLAKSSQCSAANLFRMVLDSAAASPNHFPTRREAVGFLDSLLNSFRSLIREGRLLSMVFRASKLWSCQALYNKAMRKALSEALGSTRHRFSYQTLMNSSTRSPTAEISDAVAEFANEFFSHPTDQDWNECLGELVQSLDNLTSLNAAFEDIGKRLKTEELKQSFKGWRSSIETSRFETKETLTALDLPFILSLIQSHSADDEWVSTRLLPKLSQRAEKQLLYALLKRLCAENGHLALKNTESLARRLLDATLPKLNLEIDDLEPKTQHPPQSSIYLRGASNSTAHTVSNDFILAPDQKQGRFTYAKKIRSHLEMVLPREHYRCATDTTAGQGRCQTLVVTKISKETEFKEEMKKFDDEVRQYEQRLLSFRQPVVQRLLGDETYKSLIMLETGPPDVSTVPVSSKRAADESPDQPASTRQRTEEVIDLTGE
ncbi:hypothetical protein INS49_011995 [Diaporthe citri]|uniref:uncharacterized protein n=1 Tax=Diaporthe citri TaxID=83186 RepID=UPI001C80B6B1|nr:uncharacterized protein INS49_011995 [Diaporthe citri]KAG6360927.1 hypothetical protein INS49_011995 [Diaporthe citri]